MSVLDKEVNNFYEKSKHTITLERDFIVSTKDFLNLFSACWIASQREKSSYFSNYNILSFQPGFKNAIYLEFIVKEQGWFDFCVKQVDSNMIEPSKKSSIRTQEDQNAQGKNQKNMRYLKCKFMLSRDLYYTEASKNNEAWK